MRKLTALIAAATLALTALAPVAEARDGRGHGYDRHYDRHDYRRHDDNGDAVAAGVVGLVLGLAIGSIASQPRQEPRYDDRRGDYYDGPPPGYYDERGSAYERDYGYAPGYSEPPVRARCMRGERVWDRYAGRYVIVDVPC